MTITDIKEFFGYCIEDIFKNKYIHYVCFLFLFVSIVWFILKLFDVIASFASGDIILSVLGGIFWILIISMFSLFFIVIITLYLEE